MNGHSNYCKLEPDGECYIWHWEVTNFVNASSKFSVVIGLNIADTDTDIVQIRIEDVKDNQIDAQLMERLDRDVTAAGATTTKMQAGLMRRMLVPPLGEITTSAATNVSLVDCCCLDKALAIL